MRPEPPAVELRPLRSVEDYLACVELQRDTWGRDFGDVVPMSVLKVSQKVGGIAAGAFAADGRMLGFVFGLSGVRNGRPAHWSHMLAVHPEARDLGLGTRLKLYQRELLLPAGIEVVHWTFDPLEARNAHLNLDRLGAEVAEYVEEMYAGELGSELARGIGTDRFVVAWRIASHRVEEALAGRLPRDPGRFAATPVVSAPLAAEEPLPETPRVRVEVPRSIQDLKAARPEEAAAWRAATRRAFEHYLGRGYRVETLLAEAESGRCFYALETTAAPAADRGR